MKGGDIMKEVGKKEAGTAFELGIYLNSLNLSVHEYSRLCAIVAKQANAGNEDAFLYGISVGHALSLDCYMRRDMLAMCYSFADTIAGPKGKFYVLDRATGQRYKSASTKKKARQNWRARRL